MDYKNTFRKLETTLADIEASQDIVAHAFAMLRRMVDDFGDDLGIVSGRIYDAEAGRILLRKEYPVGRMKEGFEVSTDYPPVAEVFQRGFAVHRLGDPGVDPELMESLGIESFAAIAVGDPVRLVISFSLAHEADRDKALTTLNTIRHVMNLRFRQVQLQDRVNATRAIQMSLLPREIPEFGDFEVWGHTLPAEEVGGDLYDYLSLSDRALGIAIADASGHGLPAALQARDAIIGLRMGMEENLRITVALEKLNRVISRSALASRFISMFYGELDLDGTLVYCNAGHPPPLLLSDGSCSELSDGGMILGPNPEAQYRRRYVRLPPGSMLLAYTDGITEAEGRTGDLFGVSRLQEVVEARKDDGPRAVVEAVFDEVSRFSGTSVPRDDQTAMAVLRRG